MKILHSRCLSLMGRTAVFITGILTVWILLSIRVPPLGTDSAESGGEATDRTEAEPSISQHSVEVGWLEEVEAERQLAVEPEGWRERIEPAAAEEAVPPASVVEVSPSSVAVSPNTHDAVRQAPREGDLPAIVAEFRPGLSFPEYLELVEALGARLVLYHEESGQLAGWFDRSGNVLRPLTPTIAAGMSGRTREVPGEPWLRDLDERLKLQDTEPTRWLMLFPKEWDVRVENLLRRALADAALDPANVTQMTARYRGSRRSGVGSMVLERAYLRDGQVVPVDGRLAIP